MDRESKFLRFGFIMSSVKVFNFEFIDKLIDLDYKE